MGSINLVDEDNSSTISTSAEYNSSFKYICKDVANLNKVSSMAQMLEGNRCILLHTLRSICFVYISYCRFFLGSLRSQ